MKKLNLSFLMVCCALMAWADPISKQAALYTAQSYMMAKGKSINAAKKPFRAGSKNISQTEKEAYYYVFNAGNDNGYVIVSGDDRVEPILGYVEQGTFDPDNIPENMRSWLQGYADEIKYIIDNNLNPSSPALRRSNKVRSKTRHSVPELMTTRWNQGLPYNLTLEKYPKADGTGMKRPVTGCTATAMAQVLNYYRYPDKVKVEIPAQTRTWTLDDGTKQSVTYPGVAKDTPIDWDNMRDTYNCSEEHAHTPQDTAVAELMRIVGASVKMGYGGKGGSGANFHASEFIKYFGYDEDAYRADQKNYSVDEWNDMMYNDISQGRPVCTAGWTGNGSGHSFVIDGYDGDGLFHVNWGWGGGGGWYLLTLLNGDCSEGVSAATKGFSRNQYAVFNLHLPNNIRESHLDVSSVSVLNKTYLKATFKNSTGNTGRFDVAVVRYNEKGELALVGKKLATSSISDGGTISKNFQISKQLPKGTYKLAIASKQTSCDTWKVCYNLPDKYIEAVVDADSIPTLNIVAPSSDYDITVDTIVFPGNRVVEQEQEVLVTFHNNGGEFYKDVHLMASKTNEKISLEKCVRVAAHKGETVTVSYFFTPEETGTYNLWFCTSKDGSGELGHGTMEVITEAEAEKANLSISHSIVNGTNNSNGKGGTAYGKRLYGKATVRNNGTKDYHGSIKLQLWHQQKSGGGAVSGTSKSFTLDIPARKSITFEYEFDNLSSTYNYHIKAAYVNQSGNLTGGGVWDVSIDMQDGFLTWKNDGTVSGKAHASNTSVTSTLCGFYADSGKKVSRISPNKNNPNVIYALATGMEVPASIDTCNTVSGNHAKHINLVNDQPYYIPVNFTADSVSFTYTFPETENAAGWHTFTMPFTADSVFVDGIPVSLDDSLKHFWIYEFAAQGENGEIYFAPATVLRGSTPYIIAADSTMAGRSIVFQSRDAAFFKTGSDKMIITSPDYKFHGTTFALKVKNCYVLNEDGTAFEYVTANKTLTGLSTYFTTNLPEELRLASLSLPDLPALKAGLTDSEDAITPVYSNRKNENVIYDLSGRKVNSQPKKGFYIINGKKVLR